MLLKKLIPSIGLSVFMVLTGCATQNNHIVGQQSGDDTQANHLPSAQTYGLVDNQAPAHLSAPSSYYIGSVNKVVNSLQAPSNQTYYFTENNATLNPADANALQIQANYLVTHPNAKIRLEGYADSRGSRESNVISALKEVQTIQNSLLQAGVAPTQIEVVSYGKEKPAMDGYGEPVWAKNRKVQLVYEEQ